MAKNPIVTITMEDGGIIRLELYPETAPISVNNFISLINRKFYDGLIFHRVINGFMIQGGCPEGTGMGGPGYSIKGEFAQNGIKNDLKHTEGVLSMARSMHPDSAGSQFFIMHKNAPHLDGGYAAFGKVIEGLDIVHKIEEVEVKAPEGSEENANTEISTPVNPPKITSIKVETYGEEYGLPKTLEPFDYMSWMYKQYGM